MRIKVIEFENFRIFKDRGRITCSTNGPITLILGDGGTGKTTLHQLIYWIFYGESDFDNYTTSKLYNLEYEYNCSLGSTFSVMGYIQFEHEGNDFLLSRKLTYCKGIQTSKIIGEECRLAKVENGEYTYLPDAEKVIKQILPKALAGFLFIEQRNQERWLPSSELAPTILSILNLDCLTRAIEHIGTQEHKRSALGKLRLYLCNASEAMADLKEKLKRLQYLSQSLTAKNNELILQKECIIKDQTANHAAVSEPTNSVTCESLRHIDRLLTENKQKLQSVKKLQDKYDQEYIRYCKNFDLHQEHDLKVQRQIRILEEVRNHFVARQMWVCDVYSKRLQNYVQDLLNTISAKKYKVTIDSDFSCNICDLWGNADFSQSENTIIKLVFGCGICLLAADETRLLETSYPLIIDNIFFLHDSTQMEKVSALLTQASQQVILFSHSCYRDAFPSWQIGRTYTLETNIEKTVAYVRGE